MSTHAKIPASEITPAELYFNRRTLMRGGIVVAGAAATAWLYRKVNGVELAATESAPIAGIVKPTDPSFQVADEALTKREQIINYNNFYEFTTSKDDVAKAAAGFRTDGWKITVDGLCNKPRVFDLDALRAISPTEERVYRLRCVEAWSMVVPWAGFSLSKLLAQVEPQGSAKYVAFETLHDVERMPGQSSDILDWPYREGLRMDEAMHPLTLLTTGLYGRELPPQDGAPVRMIIPWKYGFKGIKSIVRITLTDKEPPTSWSRYAPAEYGFYANVNPEHPHPRWSQATERRIGESGRRRTLPFNGYGEQVASLYTGMDLRAYF